MIFQRSFIVLLSYLVVLQAQELQYVGIGTKVNMKCAIGAKSHKNPTKYQWFGPKNEFKSSNINLIIPTFSLENEGKYTCEATQIINGAAVSTKKSVYLKLKIVNGDNTPKVSVPKKYDTFVTGILFLMCQSHKGQGHQYLFEWTTPSGRKVKSKTYFQKDMKLSDSGRYICKITRKSDGATAEGHSLVAVNELPMKIEKYSGSVTLGESVILKCMVDEQKTDKTVYTKFIYTWEDPQNRVIGNNQFIEIKLSDPSKFGKYQCTISAPSMSPPYNQTKEIDLEKLNVIKPSNIKGRNLRAQAAAVTYTGKFESSPAVIRYFSPLELICSITPDLDSIEYEIFFNNKKLTSSNKYLIPSVGKEHLGVYKCKIRGIHPNSKQTVKLDVIYNIEPDYLGGTKIELAPPPGPQIFVHPDEKKELHCEVTPNSGLLGRNVVWYFNGTEIKTDDYKRYDILVLPRLYVSIVILKKIKPENEGKYECKIAGETKEVFIIVMSKSRNINVNPKNETRYVGDNHPVEFHCQIDGYKSKNKDLVWTFISKDTGLTTALDSRWKRTDDKLADETSFLVVQQAERHDSGTYVCKDPGTGDTSSGVLNVFGGGRKAAAPGIVVTPRVITVEAGQTAQIQCYLVNVGRNPEHPDFIQTGGSQSGDARRTSIEKLEFGKIQLTFRSLTPSDNGTRFTCRKGALSAEALILVSPICAAGFRYCRNGTCINSAKFCDGKQDCVDGSDEDQQFCRQCDPLIKRCEAHEGQNPTNKIYQTHWGCDGDDDCGNGFDESKCFGSVLECGGLNYQCSDGNKTIPKAFLCDKESDCDNGDDESRCVVPTILSEAPSAYHLNYRQGETVEMRCRVTGYPLPKIIWRFNWGCLSEDGRTTVMDSYQDCSQSVSTLKIINFQPGDDGIYTCEALAGGKRAWSKEYQLFVSF